jgi:DNA polymerase III delta prime subunit
MTDLAIKYRPSKVSQLLGESNVTNLKSLIALPPNSLILHGGSGLGKTTMARIYATSMDSGPGTMGWIEHDAAVYNGVDDIRDLRQVIRGGVIDGSARVVCLDECHMLSKSSWNALLKDIEEPPNGVHWVFCTTEISKVPATIKTRSVQCSLVPLSDTEIEDLVGGLTEAEDLSDEDFGSVIRYAAGVPRRALYGVQTLASGGFLDVDGSEGVSSEIIDFCRALGNEVDLPDLVVMIAALPKGTTGEAVRRTVCAYYSKVALSAGRGADNAVAILVAFGQPYPTPDLYHVLISLTKIMDDN